MVFIYDYERLTHELKEDLCQIRLYISNLESELNILTL